ncbi:MAG: TonB-dependent receptor plug domain-containing protein [Parasphingorhabdus sp.]
MTVFLRQSFLSAIMVAFISVATAGSAGAQVTALENEEIVVIAEFPRGSVVTDVPPIEQLNTDDIESFGVSSVADLVTALSTSTSSGRGRGSGRPIVLINGQRTSGFREIRDLPPEAIKTAQVFPEELALQYGFRPDQRVINFILKDSYTGFSGEFEYGVPTQGGQGRSEVESNLTKIGKNSRLNINLEWQNATSISEAERGIVQDDAGTAVDLGQFRTLVASSDNIELNTNYSRTFENGTTISLNGGYVFNKSQGLLGLPSGNLQIGGETQFRYFTEFGPLRRTQETNTAQAGLTINGKFSDWRWTFTSDFSREQIDTDTDSSGDITELQAAIDAGTVNPLSSNFGSIIGMSVTDRARATDRTITNLATIAGSPLLLPSGPVSVTLRAGYDRKDLDSRNITDSVTTTGALGRDDFGTGINIEIPLADENTDVANTIGRLSINGNIGYSELSDVGGLWEFGFGLNWEPLDGLSFTASVIGEEAAPTVTQLGNPLIITPSVNVFDFTRGESVLASITTGGNLALPKEVRRDVKLAINYRPEWLDGMTFLAEYFRNNSRNVASSFPTLTPEIEAAFPDRVTRDATGRLIAIDRRPVNYSNVFSENIRYGFNFRKRFGQRRRGGAAERAQSRNPRAGRTRPDPQSERPIPNPNEVRKSRSPQSQTVNEGRGSQAVSGRTGNRSSAGRRPGGRSSGRWQLSAYHTIGLEDRILIRSGVQELDLLNGSATGSTGGSPGHGFELSGGWFNNGIGFRLQGEHQSATRVIGGLTGSDLQFSDLTTLNLRVFVNLDNRGNLTERFKFLKGSRIALRFDNIFNDIQDVRDNSGLVPLRYQTGFLDPAGRYIEIDFRKRF